MVSDTLKDPKFQKAAAKNLDESVERKREGAQKESFASYFGERVMSGQVRDDIFNALGAYGKNRSR